MLLAFGAAHASGVVASLIPFFQRTAGIDPSACPVEPSVVCGATTLAKTVAAVALFLGNAEAAVSHGHRRAVDESMGDPDHKAKGLHA